MLSGTAKTFLRHSCGFFLVCATLVAQQHDDGRRFLRGRIPASGFNTSSAESLLRAHSRPLRSPVASPADTSLSTPWKPLGPAQVQTSAFGAVTGRVTSIAIDPSDSSGNTVYLGTTGGGVWKSTNAAGPAANIIFTPLTDTLPVFNANTGATATPSLSIGAVSVQPGGGVILAGTGDPNDASDSYYGEGILRSTDGGTTWTLYQQTLDPWHVHNFFGQSIAGFAWSTTSPDFVVMAVSEATDGTTVGAGNPGTTARGLYYSSDAGATWKMASLVDGSQVVQSTAMSFSGYTGNAVTSVVWNPVRKKFYAAVRFHGYYESSDGQTWTRMANQPGAGLTTANCPANANIPGAQSCPIFRGVLAVQPQTGDMFAFTVDLNNADQGIWQDLCTLSGTSCTNSTVQWAKQLSAAALETSGKITQGDYNLALAAVPSGSDTILFAGTQEIFRCSLAAGCTFRNTTNATTGCSGGAKVAPAQHAMAWTGNTIYFGNDGGLWRSTDLVNQAGASCSADDAAHFENLNSGLGSLAEVHSLSSDPSNADTLLVGLGALGTAATTGTTWTQLGTGEGDTVAIDQADATHWYLQSGGGVSIYGCAKGTSCTAADFAGPAQIGATQVSNDMSLDAAPFLIDPSLHTNLLAATCRIWRGDAAGGALWSSSNTISSALAGSTGTSCNGTNAFVRALAAGGPPATSTLSQKAGATVLYAGMAGRVDGGGAYGGHIYGTTTANTATGTTAWNDLTANSVTNDAAFSYRFNPNNYDISSIAVDPHDATGLTVYATVMGFGVPHVYLSTNGGTTWLNITRNLPDVPANAIAIDPNDANTVYLATDAGVFVTTAINTCATTDCWSLYGTSLPNSPVVALETQARLHDGVLRAGTYGRGVWEIPLLTAGAVLQPSITLSPTSLSFASTPIGSASPAQTITASNSGSGVFHATRIETTGDFSASSPCVSSAVPPHGSCTISITFTPTATGTRSGTVVLYGNIAGGSVTATLSGTGAGTSSIGASPLALTFADTVVNTTSSAQVATITNSGTADGTLISITATGDFSISAKTCGTTLPAGTSCTVSVIFSPTSPGARTGILTVASATGSSQIALSGKGLAQATHTLSPASLSFAATQVNTTSASQTITLANDGDVALSLIAARILSGDFAVTNACGTSLLAHASCAMQVTFSPKSIGAQNGSLQITDALGSQTVSLSGTGTTAPGVSLTPASIAFAVTAVGNASAAQTVTLTNNGGAPLVLSAISINGDFGIVSGTNTCSTTTPLAVGTSCAMQIAFVPTAAGTRSGSLSIASNASNSPNIVSLSGTGLDFTLTSNNPTQTLKSGASAVYSVLLSPAVPMAQPVTVSCSGAPVHAKCSVSPASTDLTAPTTITVTVQTGINASKPVPAMAIGFALLFGVAWKLRRRRLPVLFLLIFCIAALGCGSGRKLPLPADGGGTGGGTTYITPSGGYSIVVSATAAGVTRSTTLSLTVQ